LLTQKGRRVTKKSIWLPAFQKDGNPRNAGAAKRRNEGVHGAGASVPDWG